MKKTTLRKTFLASLFVAFSACLSVSALSVNASADVNAITVDQATISMRKGASARISEDGNNGLRFTMETSAADYNGLRATYGEDIKFGILIAPASYTAMTEATVFTEETAIYDWATYDKATGEWVYEGQNGANGSKKRIMNLATSTMKADEEDADKYVLYGTIANVGESNYTREYVGVGYVEYTVGGVTDYLFLDDNDNTRSMAYIAQIYQTLEGISPEDKTYVNDTYLTDNVCAIDTFYTVKHMLSDGNGNYVEGDTETVENVKINGATVEPTAKTYEGYTFDEANANNSVGGETVYANGKTEISLYYINNRVRNVTKEGNVYTMHGNNQAAAAYYYTTETPATTAYYSVKVTAPNYLRTYYGANVNAGIIISQGVAQSNNVAGTYKSVEIGPSNKALCVFNNTTGGTWRNLATYNDPWTEVEDAAIGIPTDGAIKERVFTIFAHNDLLMMFVDGYYVNQIALTDTTAFKGEFVAGQPYIFGVQASLGKHEDCPVTVEILEESYGAAALSHLNELSGVGGQITQSAIDTTKSSRTIVYGVNVVTTASYGLPAMANAMGHVGIAIAPKSNTANITTMGIGHYALNMTPNSRNLLAAEGDRWNNTTVYSDYALASAHGNGSKQRGGNFTIVIYNDTIYIYAGASAKQTFIKSLSLAAGNYFTTDYCDVGGEYCVGQGSWALGASTTDPVGVYVRDRICLYGDDAIAELTNNSMYSEVGLYTAPQA